MPTAHATRRGLLWTRIRDSLWFVPTLAVLLAVALAMTAVQIPTPRTGSRLAWIWLFGGGAEGTRGVLTAIAGGLITVTGTVFSVTIVALQLASSQFTPRLLRSFVADRVNQTVLGVFIGTFTYTLLILRSIHSAGEEQDPFVPHVGVTLALVLLLASIGALIVFINHAARTMQAEVILHRQAQDTLARIARLSPARVGRPAADADVGGAAHAAGGETLPGGDPPHVIVAAVSGYLQAVDDEALWRAGAGGALTVRMEVHVGGFVIPGRALASAWPAQRVDDAVVRRVRAAFVLGPERTPEQDIEYGLIALSDIGVRALSPGINDPTTAMHAIDRLTEVLAARARQGEPDPVRTSPDGRVRLVVRDTPFERAAGVAFDQIRLFGAANPAILKRLLESVLDLATVVDGPDRGALRAQADATLRAARRAIADPVDLAAVERLAHAALAASGGDAPDDGHAPAVGERT